MLINFFKKKVIDSNENKNDNNVINVIALLIEASSIDGNITDLEINKIKDMVSKYFNIDNENINKIYQKAFDEHVKNVSFHDFTTNLNKNYSYKQKINIIEMLWFVVLVDKIEHDFESNLMRRICGLLYIRDVDSGKIRKKVREKLNI